MTIGKCAFAIAICYFRKSKTLAFARVLIAKGKCYLTTAVAGSIAAADDFSPPPGAYMLVCAVSGFSSSL